MQDHIEVMCGIVSKISTHSSSGCETQTLDPAQQPLTYFVNYLLDGAPMVIWDGTSSIQAMDTAQSFAKGSGIPVFDLTNEGV